ncbi:MULTISPECIES: AAA family ATPase [Rhodococcus]|uniref:MoxR family ATPase n=1 Tax=Rhodococcus opacus RKJ300 = JCM 13270 TaxID=1165867 RepID=I0WM54_RHOOP|nr:MULTISPECIES: MoxR family ATPase [Rhodococcus]EID77470.1 MoxR family ATPase [Rhodococcus opacus RKJ300 = JCM 13270]MDV6246693.1 MoxR family ATPase [Rhodococcus opacus]QQZ16791.1 MoxR family ATPase [Rhodococcus sp. 21391]
MSVSLDRIHEADVRDRVAARVVGRSRELELLIAALSAGRDIVLEGPPGTSKSTLLRAIAGEWGVPMFLVEGNAELSPSVMIGHHSPSEVLSSGYSDASFVPGPLVEAMTQGGILYVEEFNRAPEDTVNALLAAMSERRVVVPRVGEFTAHNGFRLIASMNVFDNLGTKRLSSSILDRMCRLSVDYQSAAEERDVVAGHVEHVVTQGIVDAVEITRATRHRDEVRQGSSVRGAIDLAMVIDRLAAMRRVEVPVSTDGVAHSGPDYIQLVRDATQVALSARVHLHRGAEVTVETVLDDILDLYFAVDLDRDPG